MSASQRRPSLAPAAAPRTAVVWDDLEPYLSAAPLSVLDIGGGTGGSAVRIAGLGHRVTVVDPSPDALAALDRRAHERGVEVTGRQGDLAEVPDLLDPGSVDLVLCHGVLEVVDDPVGALAGLRSVLRPEGRLSLLVAQRHAAVIARAMAGHFAQASALLASDPASVPADQRVRAGRRFTAEEASSVLVSAGFAIDSIHGVRVFADLVPGSLLDLEPGATAALVDLERDVASRPEYLPLATQLHLLAH